MIMITPGMNFCQVQLGTTAGQRQTTQLPAEIRMFFLSIGSIGRVDSVCIKSMNVEITAPENLLN
jgi:hypothetical protein